MRAKPALLPALLGLTFGLVCHAAPPLEPTARTALAAIEEASRASESDALLILRDGEVLTAYDSGDTAQKIEAMSVTKSVVALGVGRLLTLGKLSSLDLPVHEVYPEWKQGRKQAITLRMLLEHTSGLQNVPNAGAEIYPAPDAIRLALAAELSHTPGEWFSYNNKAVNLIGGIIGHACGQPMDRCLDEILFAPLGIERGEWYRDAAGNPHAMAGLPLAAADLARIGQLVLQEGRWNDQTLIDPSFIAQMLGASQRSREVGLLWWRRPAWTSFHADAGSFALLEKAGLRSEMLEPLRRLDGRRFDNPEALYAGLAEVLGDDWGQQWMEALTGPHGIGPWAPFHPKSGPVERFEANGSYGQYLIVVPKAGLVAVRQIIRRDDPEEHTGYHAFSEDVQRLADALVEK